MVQENTGQVKPLAGIRVIEMGQLLAGPFCGRLLAEFGAEVIKIEPPKKGDPLRVWRGLMDETQTSLWWYVQSRNKKSITLEMNQPGATEIVKKLLKEADVLLENFKPGTMEKWGLGWEQLHAEFPRLVMTRVSGWGQTGPYKDNPGYGSIGESIGGMRYITGYPDRPPVRIGISIGDSLAGMYATIGTLTAVHHRDMNGGQGQLVDVALNEAVFGLMEGMLPEYSWLGLIRERSGAAMPGISPSNTYLCKDGTYIVIAGNGDSIFKRLMRAIDRSDLADSPDFANNNLRGKRNAELDEAIGAWTARHTFAEVKEILEKAGVPVGGIYTIADIAQDPHFIARGMIQEGVVPEADATIKIPGIIPKLSETPGSTEWLGPALGHHNREIYGGLLGLSEDELAKMEVKGMI